MSLKSGLHGAEIHARCDWTLDKQTLIGSVWRIEHFFNILSVQVCPNHGQKITNRNPVLGFAKSMQGFTQANRTYCFVHKNVILDLVILRYRESLIWSWCLSYQRYKRVSTLLYFKLSTLSRFLKLRTNAEGKESCCCIFFTSVFVFGAVYFKYDNSWVLVPTVCISLLSLQTPHTSIALFLL